MAATPPLYFVQTTRRGSVTHRPVTRHWLRAVPDATAHWFLATWLSGIPNAVPCCTYISAWPDFQRPISLSAKWPWGKWWGRENGTAHQHLLALVDGRPQSGRAMLIQRLRVDEAMLLPKAQP